MRRDQHPLYQTWRGMIDRCLNAKPGTRLHLHYRGRGISVCDRWLHSFDLFVSDMGPKPTPKHTLDRKNNDGNYEPDNCVWATKEEQSRNRRPLPIHSLKGERVLPTPGHEKLRSLLRGGLSLSTCGSVVGTDKSVVSRWASGECTPSLAFCIALERLYGIPSTDWLTPPERLIAFTGSSLVEPFPVRAADPSPGTEAV